MLLGNILYKFQRVWNIYIRIILYIGVFVFLKKLFLLDLKGPNILVDRDGICKLSDFGGSKIMAETLGVKKQKYSFKGTPNWMAPEVVKNLDYSR